MARKMRNIVIDWSDVKDRYIRSVERGEAWPSQPAMGPRLAAYHRDPYNPDPMGEYDEEDEFGIDEEAWAGGTGADCLKWLREGYHAPEFLHAAEYVATAERMRNTWNSEEGDFDIFRAAAGRDDCFLGPHKRLSKPGLRVQIEFAFAWTVSSKTIQEYGAWCAGFLGSLEKEGYDLVVDLWIPLDSLYEGDGYLRSNVLIRVKRPNEVSDFTEWSSLFSPCGYRHLGFTAKCVAGDKIGKKAVSYLGQTVGGKTWGVDYDKDEAIVRITCNQQAGKREKLPFEKMNEAARKSGLLPQIVDKKEELV